MITKTSEKEKTRKRHYRIRNKVSGTKERPRLSIYKSNKYIYAQLIDPTGKSLAGVKAKKADEAGQKIGEKAKKLGVKEIVYDRGAYKYHGQVKALAEAARAAGLAF